MHCSNRSFCFVILAACTLAAAFALAKERAVAPVNVPSSYLPTIIPEPFNEVLERMTAEKSGLMKRQLALLRERYDLTDAAIPGVTMSRGKPVQGGVRVKTPAGVTWDELGKMTPVQIKAKDLFPAGFFPLPHPKQFEGGMVFPHLEIEELKRQEGRDLTRFDVDFDIPDLFLPEFPPAIFIQHRLDLGDVSQGKLVTLANFFELFNGILNPKQIEGLRLLLTPFPQQQFNQTEDRRSVAPSRGVACLDCHANGHTNGATHLVQDSRPNAFRRRVDTPTLRGLDIQRLFGSQRALKTVEDFTQFEQLGAYFDGDFPTAIKKGMNFLNRDIQVHAMAEFQEMLAFPPAPKLNVLGMLEGGGATEAETRGQTLFFGKARCGLCHPAPFYTDNMMHDLQVERFFNARMINGRMAAKDGMIKTFPLRGIKDSPPYLHDGRLLTLDDTVAFFNLVLGLGLTMEEQHDIALFMTAL